MHQKGILRVVLRCGRTQFSELSRLRANVNAAPFIYSLSLISPTIRFGGPYPEPLITLKYSMRMIKTNFGDFDAFEGSSMYFWNFIHLRVQQCWGSLQLVFGFGHGTGISTS